MFYFDKILEKNVLKTDIFGSLNHFFTTREFLLKTKDEALFQEAFSNRERLKDKFKLNALLSPQQRHTSNIQFAGVAKNEYPETDALILKEKNVGIFLNFADCIPVILYDTEQNIAAVVHAGWRGTAAKIVQKTVFKMNSNPKDILAAIGPGICFECFETSSEIADTLSKTLKNPDGATKCECGKWFADLKGINKMQLLDAGVQKIDIAPFCTCCNNDKFFSYRKENKTTNRISAFVSLD